jgi:ribonuclease P protein subunit RPR2
LRKRNKNRKTFYKDLVQQRMQILYNQAVNDIRKGDIEHARMLTHLIKKLSTRNRVKIPINIKRGICKNCGVPLIPGLTSRVRIIRDGRTSRVVVTCNVCGWIHRYPFKPHRGTGK